MQLRHLAQATPLSVELHASCLSQVRSLPKLRRTSCITPSDFIKLVGVEYYLKGQHYTDPKFPRVTDEVASLGSSRSVGVTALLQVTPSVLVQE